VAQPARRPAPGAWRRTEYGADNEHTEVL
jgi:hypothetical protein